MSDLYEARAIEETVGPMWEVVIVGDTSGEAYCVTGEEAAKHIAAALNALPSTQDNEPGLREAAQEVLDAFDGGQHDIIHNDLDMALGRLKKVVRNLPAALSSRPTSDSGGLEVAWAAVEKALPDGWVLDGLRRLYLDGAETTGWDARAVKPTPLPDEGYTSVPVEKASAASPAAALLALTARLASKPSVDPEETP